MTERVYVVCSSGATFLYVFGLFDARPDLVLVCFGGAGHECLVEAGTEVVVVSQGVFAA
jgi:hypothetical protein